MAPSTVSAASTSSPSADIEDVHLFVCVHGLFGTPEDLVYFSNTIVRASARGSFVAQPAKGSGGTFDGELAFVEPDGVGHGDEVDGEADAASDAQHQAAQEEGRFQPIVVVLNSHANIDYTFDGIDFCGARLAEEIKAHARQLRLRRNRRGQHRRLSHISFLGHSLGGLIARFSVGLLEQEGFFTSVSPDQVPKDVAEESTRAVLEMAPKPAIFSTFATPHIGMPPESRTGRPWLARLTAATMGRTGMQLYLLDDGWTPDTAESSSPSGRAVTPRRGVLEAMSMPNSTFMVGVARFERLVGYANATYDFPVPFRTASIYTIDPFETCGLTLDMHKDYDGIITRYTLPASKLPLMQRLRWRLTPPTLFNARRIPAAFPLNWLIVFTMPLALLFLPPLLGLTIIFFRAYAKTSTKRVHGLMRQGREEEEARRTAMTKTSTLEDGSASGSAFVIPKDASSSSAAAAAATSKARARASKATLEQDLAWYAKRQAYFSRPASAPAISEMMAASFHPDQAAGSSGVDATLASIDAAAEDGQALSELAANLLANCRSSSAYPLPSTLPSSQRRLHVPQLRMVSRWTALFGERFERHFVKFEDALDTHPLIVVRREAADVRGSGIVRHFVDHYLKAVA